MPKTKTAQALYQTEKKRAEKERRAAHAALMKEAKAAFDQMIEDGKAARPEKIETKRGADRKIRPSFFRPSESATGELPRIAQFVLSAH